MDKDKEIKQIVKVQNKMIKKLKKLGYGEHDIILDSIRVCDLREHLYPQHEKKFRVWLEFHKD